MNVFTKIQNDFNEFKNANNAKQILIDILNKKINNFFRKQKKQLIIQTFAIFKQIFAILFFNKNIDDVINKIKFIH